MKFVAQHDQMDCGPACLAMIANSYGKNYSLQFIRDNSYISREGVSLLSLSDTSVEMGFKPFPAQLSIHKLKELKSELPCLLHWDKEHFVVLKKITKNIFTQNYLFHIADPSHGFIKLNEDDFSKSWISDDNKGVALFLTPTELFYSKKIREVNTLKIKYVLSYLYH